MESWSYKKRKRRSIIYNCTLCALWFTILFEKSSMCVSVWCVPSSSLSTKAALPFSIPCTNLDVGLKTLVFYLSCVPVARVDDDSNNDFFCYNALACLHAVPLPHDIQTTEKRFTGSRHRIMFCRGIDYVLCVCVCPHVLRLLLSFLLFHA